MSLLYASYYDEDCGPFAIALLKRLVAFDTAFHVRWPMPQLHDVSLRRANLDAAEQIVAIIGPGWEYVRAGAQDRRIADPHDPMNYDLRHALQHAIPLAIVLVDRAALPRHADLPPALYALERIPPLKCRQTDDLSLNAVRLRMKLAALASAA